MTGLGRLLAQENTASDLLAYLIELDPVRLAAVLGQPAGEYTARREATIGGRSSRLDLVIRRPDALDPVAVLELKGASGEHNDQLDRYAERITGTARGVPGRANPKALSAEWHGGLSGRRNSQPDFYQDKQVRLATQFKLEIGLVNRHDVADMIRAMLDHLEASVAPAVTPDL